MVALQHLLPDGSLHLVNVIVLVAAHDSERTKDVVFHPDIELLHIAELEGLCLLFGHGFVPFGQAMTSLGRQQLALLTARRKSSPRVPCRVIGLAWRFRPGADPRAEPWAEPLPGLDAGWWRLQ